ncbi:MAG TPA: PucR family transcriptional regulator ligand-binding domain-containing protein [Nocardioidaceae bacterium]|nr:PucR family transcriptional regulator ligand-binding domain-containing protein [Nocardioidaceae bacterium]
MGKVANDRGQGAPELPTGEAVPATSAMSVERMLSLPAFSGAEVLAGADGLDRVVRGANVMEVPDIVSWVRPEALLLTTGYPLREVGTGLAELVANLDDRGVSALAVKLHRYLDSLPEDMLAEADTRGLPIILVPDDVAFDDVLTQVFTNVVSERASVLERSDEVQRRLVDIVLSGGGVADVAASVSQLFSGVAMITTADGRVLAEAGDADHLARVQGSRAFHPSGRFRTEASSVGVHQVEGLPGSHAVVAIEGGRIDHGRLVVFHPGRVMSRVDLVVLGRAATVAAVSLTKEIAITAVESKYRGDFLRDVLSGRAGSPEDVLGHARALGWDMARPMVVVVAALETEEAPPMTLGYEGPLELERFEAAWLGVVARQDPSVPVVGFASEVVALLPLLEGASPGQVVDPVLTGVAGDGGGGRRPFATGVSRPVAQVDSLPAAYEQARKALRVGRQLHGTRAVTYFDDLGVFRLLSLIEDAGELDRFVAETLGELAAPTEEAVDLRQTLQVLLDTNLNVAETARRLHFHYNTLRYRIGKLERMVGPFTTDPHLRMDLGLALRIVTMRSA